MDVRLVPVFAGAPPRTSTPFDLVARTLVAGGTRLDDDADTAATVTYALSLDGASAGSGSLAWEAHGYEGAWVKRITLPATAGILVAVVTASATVDGATVTARAQTSVRVTA